MHIQISRKHTCAFSITMLSILIFLFPPPPPPPSCCTIALSFYCCALNQSIIIPVYYYYYYSICIRNLKTLLPLPIYPPQPLKCVQQQTRPSRPRSRSTVTSPPMRTIPSLLVAFQMSAVCGPLSMSFMTDLGRRIANTTGDKSSLAYLMQKFSVAIQRGNAASVLGTLPPTLSPPLNDMLCT